MTERERQCYRILHTQGEAALEAEVGHETLGQLLNRWEDTKAIRIKNLNPGRAPVPVVTMTAEEKAAWNAHVLANSGYTIKTYAKYAA